MNHSSRTRPVGTVVAAVLVALHAAAFAAEPKIEELELAPAAHLVGSTLYFDGIEQAGIAVLGQKYAFSPDGKHIACIGHATDNPEHKGLFLDGKLVNGNAYSPHDVSRPMFTPDSQHLFWVGRREFTDPDDRDLSLLYVDGKPTVKFALDPGVTWPGAWEMAPEGVLTFIASIGATGEEIKRFRTKPSPDAGVATMLAAAN